MPGFDYIGGLSASAPPAAAAVSPSDTPSGSGVVAGGALATIGNLAGFGLGQWSANRQMDFQREMANTSWQRGVADMRAAGINPLVAFMRGGADTPGGASTSGPDLSAVGSAVSSNAKMQALEVPLMRSTLALNTASAMDKRSSSFANVAAENKAIQEKDESAARTKQIEALTPLLALEKAAAIKLAEANAALANSSAKKIGWDVKNMKLDMPGKFFRGRLWEAGNEMMNLGNRATFGPEFRLQGIEDVYGSGQGNAYGGQHSAKE